MLNFISMEIQTFFSVKMIFNQNNTATYEEMKKREILCGCLLELAKYKSVKKNLIFK